MMFCRFVDQFQWLGHCCDCRIGREIEDGNEGLADRVNSFTPSIEILCRTVPAGNCPVMAELNQPVVVRIADLGEPDAIMRHTDVPHN